MRRLGIQLVAKDVRLRFVRWRDRPYPLGFCFRCGDEELLSSDCMIGIKLGFLQLLFLVKLYVASIKLSNKLFPIEKH